MRHYMLILRRIAVKDFNIRDKTVIFKLEFSYKDKDKIKEDFIEWKSSLEFPDLEAHKIVQEARKKIRRMHTDIVTVEAEEDQKDLINALLRAKDLANQLFIKKDSDGYIQMVDRLKSFEVVFKQKS